MSPGFSVILRQGPCMAFATWTGATWRLFLFDTDAIRCEDCGDYASFTEAAQTAARHRRPHVEA
jgi:hypothetical protein